MISSSITMNNYQLTMNNAQPHPGRLYPRTSTNPHPQPYKDTKEYETLPSTTQYKDLLPQKNTD